jgi:tryptophan 2,3-dioxygenase
VKITADCGDYSVPDGDSKGPLAGVGMPSSRPRPVDSSRDLNFRKKPPGVRLGKKERSHEIDRDRRRHPSAMLRESRMEMTYASYLKLDQLLDLQEPRSHPAEHDEMLFIISHQAYELWFKLQLHELDRIKRDFLDNHLYGVIATFKRARTIMKVMVEQIDILETLTPRSFNSFRARLETASGFQSSQFREFEFVLGYKRKDMLRYQQGGTPAYERLLRRLHEPSLVDCFYIFLEQHEVAIPSELRARDIAEPSIPNETVEEGILRLYKSQPQLEILFELMTDFDEGFQEWRYRHIKLVERSIGSKQGTGGSLGVDFLKQSLFHPVFHDLWAIRHKL